MKIGIPKEKVKGETRVALVPPHIKELIKKNHEIFVETGAGENAAFSDDDYKKEGASIIEDSNQLYALSDVILKVQPPTTGEIERLKENSVYIGLLSLFKDSCILDDFNKKKITSFAMEFIPRITRAQSMDSLSSMATVAGYKAVLIAADNLPKLFPLLMTAAGTVPPASVLVLGAGVAGLQAIATAKRLGAKVEAFDPRPAVKEQVMSLGARFVEMEQEENVETAGGYAKEQSKDFLQREQEAIAGRLAKTDVVITTAQIFGKASPILITEEMVKLMKPGSVIVDIAAEQGGNCELTQADQIVEKHGVKIFGSVNLPATMPVDASQLYSKNVTNLVSLLFQGETFPDFGDEIVKGACITYNGETVNSFLKERLKIGG